MVHGQLSPFIHHLSPASAFTSPLPYQSTRDKMMVLALLGHTTLRANLGKAVFPCLPAEAFYTSKEILLDLAELQAIGDPELLLVLPTALKLMEKQSWPDQRKASKGIPRSQSVTTQSCTSGGKRALWLFLTPTASKTKLLSSLRIVKY